MSMDWWLYPLFFLTGSAMSFLNSIAGGGSTLSLPLFLWMGLPVDLTMGTNRFGVFLGNLGSLYKLNQAGKLESRPLFAFLPAIICGSLLGSYLVVGISEKNFRLLLVFVLLLASFSTMRSLSVSSASEKSAWIRMLVFFGMGFYGGYFQAGMGYVMIFCLSWLGGRDLLKINASKSLISAVIVSFSVLYFVFLGEVHWGLALVFGTGAWFGGALGARTQLRVSQGGVKKFILLVSILLAIKLLWEYFSF